MRDFKVGDRVRLVNEDKTVDGEHPSWANTQYIAESVYAGEFVIVDDYGPMRTGSQQYTLHGVTPLPDGGVALIFRDGCDLIPESEFVQRWQTRRLTVIPARCEGQSDE